MTDEPRARADDGHTDPASDAATGAPPPASPAATRGGAWLTYRYRFGGEGTPEATGTIKAPSFLTAARRALARGLDATLGPGPAYLRLRAAGEQEVLFRVERTGAGGADALRVDVVPGAESPFAAAADLPAAAPEEPPPP
jgi:hypothetical protein